MGTIQIRTGTARAYSPRRYDGIVVFATARSRGYQWAASEFVPTGQDRQPIYARLALKVLADAQSV